MTDAPVPELAASELGLAAQLRQRALTAAAAAVRDGLPPAASALRVAAFERLRHGVVPTGAELANAAGISERATAGLLEVMAALGLVELNADQVVGSRGLTVRTTSHTLILDGVRLHTWCALDALGIPVALRADALAGSACWWCGAVQEVRYVGGEPLDAAGLRAWFPHGCSSGRDDFCPRANLFCNDKHAAAWRAAAADPAGQMLDLAGVAEFAHATWGDLAEAINTPHVEETTSR